MSFGKKTPLFAPVTEPMLPILIREYPDVPEPMIRNTFKILTKNLTTESLLFTAIIDMIARFRRGEREDEPNYGVFGAGTKLSAVKHDGSGKQQSWLMELLHDVVVESWMAMGNMRQLQSYLCGEGMTIVSLHSCYMLVIAADDEDAFYDACECDQARRTRLDWTGVTERNVPVDRLLTETEYTAREADVAKHMLAMTIQMLLAGGVVTTEEAHFLAL